MRPDSRVAGLRERAADGGRGRPAHRGCGWGRSPDRINHRNGYRERGWETRVGRIELAIPKLRKGSYFPAFLEPRRTAEKAPDRSHPRGLRAWGSRPARSTTWSRPWAAQAFPRAKSRVCARHRRPRPGVPQPTDRGPGPYCGSTPLPEIAAGRSIVMSQS